MDDRPITGATYYDWEEMYEQYLGVVLPKGETIVGSTFKLKWLQDNMSPVCLHCHSVVYLNLKNCLEPIMMNDIEICSHAREAYGHHR